MRKLFKDFAVIILFTVALNVLMIIVIVSEQNQPSRVILYDKTGSDGNKEPVYGYFNNKR